MNSEFATLAQETYVSLTTFRRTGVPVATPVWITERDGALYVITDASSGKAKRIRHTAKVTLTPCDMRGHVSGGVEVTGYATLVDPAGTAMVKRLVADKYGVMAKLIGVRTLATDLLAKVTGKSGSNQVGIKIEPEASTQ